MMFGFTDRDGNRKVTACPTCGEQSASTVGSFSINDHVAFGRLRFACGADIEMRGEETTVHAPCGTIRPKRRWWFGVKQSERG